MYGGTEGLVLVRAAHGVSGPSDGRVAGTDWGMKQPRACAAAERRRRMSLAAPPLMSAPQLAVGRAAPQYSRAARWRASPRKPRRSAAIFFLLFHSLLDAAMLDGTAEAPAASVVDPQAADVGDRRAAVRAEEAANAV